MEIQFSIKIHDHVKDKLLALAALVCATAAIVGVQVLFPQAAPVIGCLLLLALFAYVTQTQPSQSRTPATPAPRWATPQPTAPATHTPAPVAPVATVATAKTKARKAAASARMQLVTA